MIWIIGGTNVSTQLASRLINYGKNILLSVTTEYGQTLARQTGASVIMQKLTAAEMETVIDDYSIEQIIDASHPYAVEVSKNAIIAAQNKNCQYIRFERKEIEYENVRYFSDYTDVINYLLHTEGFILTTTGSKYISKYIPLGTNRIIARVLASSESLIQCEAAGILPEQIIASKGLWSIDFTVALLKEYNIKYLVTKDSGAEGGLNEKIEAAHRCDVEILIISRPKIAYPACCTDLEVLLSLLSIQPSP